MTLLCAVTQLAGSRFYEIVVELPYDPVGELYYVDVEARPTNKAMSQ